ncbi:MAG: DUF192 domain-containing protein [Candidatus Omnitrophota bacterium]|jgi:hypothetical protein
MSCKIFNKTKGRYLAENAKVARTFLQKLIGLMFRASILSDAALIFHNVNSIHMFFMRFPIDVIYLNRDNKVLKIKHSLKPWRMSSCIRAKATIELPSRKARETATEIGDTLEFIEE